MHAVIYARVSTEEQGNNNSIPSQIAAARQYAADRGWQVVAELSDMVSGATLERPALQQMRDLIRARAVQAVIVYSLDRLSRNVAHMLLLRDEMHAASVELHAVTRGQSAETAEGRLFDTIESAFAEYERLKIKERSTRGKRARLESGKVLAQGTRSSYGYRYVGERRNRTIEVNEEEAVWARRIFEWAAEGATTYVIMRRLNTANVPPPGNARGVRAKQWHRSTVNRIIRNPVYRGEHQSKVFNISVPVPALVSEALWYAANAQLKANKQNACQVAKRFYPLRGRVRCGTCGGACVGTATNQRKYFFYVCIGVAKSESYRCEHPTWIQAKRLENAVWQWVVDNVLDETRLIDAITQANAGERERRTELERERAVYAAQIEDAVRRLARLIDAYTAGVLDLESFVAAKKRFDDQKAAAQQELTRIDGLLADEQQRQIDRDGILALARQLRQALADDVTPEEQARVYAALDLHIIATHDTAKIEVRLTGDVADLRVLSRSFRHRRHSNRHCRNSDS